MHQDNPPESTRSEAETLAPGRLIRLPSALHLVGLGRSAWLDLVHKRKAPQPVKIGRASLWVEAEVRAFIAERIRHSRETQR
jgi:prophage regulatory protein